MSTTETEIEILLNSLNIDSAHTGSQTLVNQSDLNACWNLTLYFKILTMDRGIRPKSLDNTVRSIWARFGIQGFNVLSENLFSVVVSNADSIDEIINSGPWTYLGDFILFHRPIEGVKPQDLNFDVLTLWLQLHDIPLAYLTTNVVSSLLDGFGQIHFMDPLLAQRWSRFARVRIDVKPDFLIKDSSTTLINGKFPLTSRIVYERLVRFCHVCCHVGHDDTNCKLRIKAVTIIQSDIDSVLKDQIKASILPKISDSVKDASIPLLGCQHNTPVSALAVLSIAENHDAGHYAKADLSTSNSLRQQDLRANTESGTHVSLQVWPCHNTTPLHCCTTPLTTTTMLDHGGLLSKHVAVSGSGMKASSSVELGTQSQLKSTNLIANIESGTHVSSQVCALSIPASASFPTYTTSTIVTNSNFCEPAPMLQLLSTNEYTMKRECDLHSSQLRYTVGEVKKQHTNTMKRAGDQHSSQLMYTDEKDKKQTTATMKRVGDQHSSQLMYTAEEEKKLQTNVFLEAACNLDVTAMSSSTNLANIDFQNDVSHKVLSLPFLSSKRTYTRMMHTAALDTNINQSSCDTIMSDANPGDANGAAAPVNRQILKQRARLNKVQKSAALEKTQSVIRHEGFVANQVASPLVSQKVWTAPIQMNSTCIPISKHDTANSILGTIVPDNGKENLNAGQFSNSFNENSGIGVQRPIELVKTHPAIRPDVSVANKVASPLVSQEVWTAPVQVNTLCITLSQLDTANVDPRTILQVPDKQKHNAGNYTNTSNVHLNSGSEILALGESKEGYTIDKKAGLLHTVSTSLTFNVEPDVFEANKVVYPLVSREIKKQAIFYMHRVLNSLKRTPVLALACEEITTMFERFLLLGSASESTGCCGSVAYVKCVEGLANLDAIEVCKYYLEVLQDAAGFAADDGY